MTKKKLALVYGTLPTVEEIDQFQLMTTDYDVSVLSSESICAYISQNSRFQNLRCVALADHDDNPMYLPGLEKALAGYDVVICKERLGIYAYQVVKAKWRHRFRLGVWVDNLAANPGEDIDQMRIIRHEISNAADLFLVQTEAARETLRVEGIADARICSFTPWVQPYAKRTKKTRAAALEHIGCAEGDIIIAHTGQVEWEEAIIDLAHAVKVAHNIDPRNAQRIKVVFCGIGSFATQLRNTFIDHKLDDRVLYLAPSRDALSVVMHAADAVFISGFPGRDRVEGEPYRMISAMANEIPVIANRTPIVDEFCGKHRFDFCGGSITSLAEALCKAAEGVSLRTDIAKKNAQAYRARATEEKVKSDMQYMLSALVSVADTNPDNAIDQQVREVEAKVIAKQYLAAIDLIEKIFKDQACPIHHRSNLYRLVGDCFAKLGDNDAAKDAYIKSIEYDQYSAKAYIGLGTVSLVKGGNDVAVLHFQKAITLAPEDEMANFGLGLSFQGMGEVNEASKWVVKALEVNPENTPALFTLVRLAYDRNNFTDAEVALRRYLTKHPHDLNMTYALAGLLFKMERFSDVIATTQQIIDADAQDARAHVLQKQAQAAMTGMGSVAGSK